MRLDPNPLFRKMIAPWHDSTTTCVVVLIAMGLIMVFSWAGIAAARGNPDYHDLVWMPIFLLLLCLWVCISVGYRLARRYYFRHQQNKEI
ncbi:MAG: hypothetical protein M0036_10580 [Desulfobacteraceae bacterium]|nr:hypothetical protein [Desulfobacteraceae bacterium]